LTRGELSTGATFAFLNKKHIKCDEDALMFTWKFEDNVRKKLKNNKQKLSKQH